MKRFFSKIVGWLCHVPSDKVLHALVSAVIYTVYFGAFVGCEFCKFPTAFDNPEQTVYMVRRALVAAAIWTMFFGLVKEVLDSRFDVWDIVADLIGMAIPASIVITVLVAIY